MKTCCKCGKKEADKIIENKPFCNHCALILMQQIREMFGFNAEKT